MPDIEFDFVKNARNIKERKIRVISLRRANNREERTYATEPE
jgi:uncharacterized DUF497 family protein